MLASVAEGGGLRDGWAWLSGAVMLLQDTGKKSARLGIRQTLRRPGVWNLGGCGSGNKFPLLVTWVCEETKARYCIVRNRKAG